MAAKGSAQGMQLLFYLLLLLQSCCCCCFSAVVNLTNNLSAAFAPIFF